MSRPPARDDDRRRSRGHGSCGPPARRSRPPRRRAGAARGCARPAVGTCRLAVPRPGAGPVRGVQVRADGARHRDELPRGPPVPRRPLGRPGQLHGRWSPTRPSARRSGTPSSWRSARPAARCCSVWCSRCCSRARARHLWFVRTAVFLPTVAAMAVVAEVWRILYYPAPDGRHQHHPGLVGHGPVAVPQLRGHVAVVGDGAWASGAARRTT